jgi:hypothetical protein
VNKQFQIIELVVRIALFDRKWNSNELANHVLHCMNTRLMLPLCDWTSVQLDRVESNTVALEEFPTINVGMFYPLYSYPEMSALFSN